MNNKITITIDEINQCLRQVDKNLRVHSFRRKEGRISGVSVTFPLKGNKRIINKLESMGWKKAHRRKVRTDNSLMRIQYEGYVMYQYMTLTLNQREYEVL